MILSWSPKRVPGFCAPRTISAPARPISRLSLPLYRYPGGPSDAPREEADSALKLAREVYDAVLKRLPEEVRPLDRQTS